MTQEREEMERERAAENTLETEEMKDYCERLEVLLESFVSDIGIHMEECEELPDFDEYEESNGEEFLDFEGYKDTLCPCQGGNLPGENVSLRNIIFV